jgi:hypothetical protein
MTSSSFIKDDMLIDPSMQNEPDGVSPPEQQFHLSGRQRAPLALLLS